MLSMKKGTKRKAATVTTSRLRRKSTETKDCNSSILREWASHRDESYHDFQPQEAEAIRGALLSWYRTNRRRLPWRGDSPPFDGSTAGIASNTKTSSKKKVNDNSQPTIKSFFAPTAAPAADEAPEPKQGTIDEGALHVSAYGVWVSEIMLQQTRVEAVIPYYIKWMERFPTVYDLASASEEDVNAHWAGLGFYRRARLLHKGAKRVVEEYNGELPKTVEGLLKIDGIGRYTASAIASIAFDVCVPVVDGNVCRVLSRLRGIANHIKAPIFKDDIGWNLAEQIISAGDGKYAGEVNQAIMELGATYCAPSGSGVDDRDPLKRFYLSTQLGLAFAQELETSDKNSKSGSISNHLAGESGGGACRLCDPSGIQTVINEISDNVENAQDPIQSATAGHAVFPLSPPKKAKREEILAVAAVSWTKPATIKERWLLVKRPKEGLLAGQWEFPSACVWTSQTSKKKGKASKRQPGYKTVPLVDPVRRKDALNSFLGELTTAASGSYVHSWLNSCSRDNVGASPLEHIFSHVRHTMWIEYGESRKGSTDVEGWIDASGREIRWMSETDMDQVGVTSGVKKILKLVKANRL